jgi:methanogenic corrinoid protein MtbC1
MLATVGLGIETMFSYVDKMNAISTHDVAQVAKQSYFSPSVLLAASKLSEISNIGKPLVCTNKTSAPSGVIQC